jgi:TP901 family phage tail tape measure protein
MAERIVKVSLIAQVNNYLTGVEAARRKTVEAGEAAETASAKYERQAQAMRDMGVRMTAFGAIATAATGLAIKAAIDWESAWTGVTKTVNGTPLELGVLEDQLRSLTRVLPATHEEIAAVAEAAGQLGVEAPNIAAFTKTMIDLSETTNLTADEAATSIAQFMNIMQSAPQDVDNLGASLVALGNDGASTERDIIQMAQRIAGAGKIVGLTEGQVLGLANALSSVGIEADAGGSAISNVMTDIAMAVSQGGDKLQTFATVAGMSSKDFQKAFKDDPANAIATFIEGLARIDKQGGDVFQTLSDLGQTDIRVSRALLGMANSGDLLRKSLDLGNTAWDENTALLAEAEKRYQTTEARIQIAGNAIRDAAISYGDVFLPVVKATADAVATLAGGFSDLPAPIQTTVAVTTALVGVATLAGGAFLLAVPKIAAFNAQLQILRASEIPGVAAAAQTATAVQGKFTAGLGATARFLTGPWAAALAVAGVGLLELQKIMEQLDATAAEMQNSLKTASSGTILSTASKSGYNLFFKDALAQFQDLDDLLQRIDDFQSGKTANIFNFGNNAALMAPVDALSRIGDELASLASEDAPAAGKAFAELASETDGSEKSLSRLLNAMPAYRDALIQQATEQGINVTGMSDAERMHTLLRIATEDTTDATSEFEAETQAANEQLDQMKTNLDEVAGKAMSMGDAVDRAQGTINKLTEEWKRAADAQTAAGDTAGKTAEQIDRDRQAAEEFRITLDGTNDASISFRDSIREVETSHRDAAKAIIDNGGTLDEAKAKWDEGREAVLQQIEAMGLSRDEAIKWADQNLGSASDVQSALRDVANAVNNIPDKKVVTLVADAAPAYATVNKFIFDNNNRRINFYVDGFVGRQVAGSNLIDVARAGGGRIPGRPSRRDNIIAALATGEYVVNSTATEKNLPALEYINRGGVIPHFANGGRAGDVQPRYASENGYGYASRTIYIAPVVNAAPGMDENALVRKVVREVEKELK